MTHLRHIHDTSEIHLVTSHVLVPTKMILNSRQIVAGAHLGSHIRIEVTKRVKTKLRRDDSDFN